MGEPGVTVHCVNDELIVSWRSLSRYEHDRTVQIMRDLPGATYDPAAKAWRVPLRQADRLIEALPNASYSYDAVCAAVDASAARIDRFMRNLRALGVRFELRAGRVLAFGDNVSPLVQQLVDERNAAALAWLRENPEPAPAPTSALALEYSAETWRQAELLKTSLHNAARNQYHRKGARVRPASAGWGIAPP